MTALLSLGDISVTRNGRPVLESLSLSIEDGERIALVGENGSGKTTLMRTIVGLQPSTGTIVAYGNRCRTEADFRKMRMKTAYLFQDPDDQLFCPTVLEDVAFGPLNLGLRRPEALELARALLRDLDLEPLADRITHHLSGGEKRLVSLAAVLAMQPRILLLDEPTNALDAPHMERMVDILSRQTVAMVVASHDWSLLEKLTDRAVVLKHGHLIPAVLHRHLQWADHVHLHEEEDLGSPLDP